MSILCVAASSEYWVQNSGVNCLERGKKLEHIYSRLCSTWDHRHGSCPLCVRILAQNMLIFGGFWYWGIEYGHVPSCLDFYRVLSLISLPGENCSGVKPCFAESVKHWHALRCPGQKLTSLICLICWHPCITVQGMEKEGGQDWEHWFLFYSLSFGAMCGVMVSTSVFLVCHQC